MNIFKNRCKTMIWCLFLLPIASGQAQAQKPLVAAKGLQQQQAANIYINGGKYRLIQRYPDYWLLTDLQNFQQVHLTNQLVVSGACSADELGKRVKMKPVFTVKPITDGVLSISGTIAELMQLETQLKQLEGIRTEWQLFYLPLKSQPEN